MKLTHACKVTSFHANPPQHTMILDQPKKQVNSRKPCAHGGKYLKNKVASPLLTSHFLTLLSPPHLFNFAASAVCFSNGEQSLLKFVELFPRGVPMHSIA